MQAGYWTLLKWGCLALSVGSIVVAGVQMWMHDEPLLEEKAQAGDEPELPQTNVEKLLIVERKGEHIVWRLQAESARQQENGMNLTDPKLELFTEQGEAVPIRAEKAWFEPAARNIRFNDSVNVRFRGWELQSGELQYDSGRGEVVVPGSFELFETGTVLRGEGLRAQRSGQLLMVEHSVELEDRVYVKTSGGGPVRITSDSLIVDHAKKRADFTGVVHLQRDNFTLRSDRLVVFYREEMGGDIERADAYGNVVMTQQEKQGSSDRAIYRQRENELELIGNAEVTGQEGTVRGESLLHHLDTKLTTVKQGESGKRARMTIEEENTNP